MAELTAGSFAAVIATSLKRAAAEDGGGQECAWTGEDEGGKHLISKDDVPKWLADSQNKQITNHFTDPEGARRILAHGVNIEKYSSRLGFVGKGFYTTTAASGGTTGAAAVGARVQVAIRMTNPWRGSWNDLERAMGTADLTTRASRIPGWLRSRGYDGLIMQFEERKMGTWMMAINNSSVKVVR